MTKDAESEPEAPAVESKKPTFVHVRFNATIVLDGHDYRAGEEAELEQTEQVNALIESGILSVV